MGNVVVDRSIASEIPIPSERDGQTVCLTLLDRRRLEEEDTRYECRHDDTCLYFCSAVSKTVMLPAATYV